eukprot:1007670-Pyramimonas_sp.AAC.1
MSVTGHPSWRSSQDLNRSAHTASTTRLKSKGLSVPPVRMERSQDVVAFKPSKHNIPDVPTRGSRIPC